MRAGLLAWLASGCKVATNGCIVGGVPRTKVVVWVCMAHYFCFFCFLLFRVADVRVLSMKVWIFFSWMFVSVWFGNADWRGWMLDFILISPEFFLFGDNGIISFVSGLWFLRWKASWELFLLSVNNLALCWSQEQRSKAKQANCIFLDLLSHLDNSNISTRFDSNKALLPMRSVSLRTPPVCARINDVVCNFLPTVLSCSSAPEILNLVV